MARNSVRVREFGIRASLGAGLGRLTRQLLTESLVLALIGGALGIASSLLLSAWLQAAFYSTDSQGHRLYYNFTPEIPVAMTVLGVSTLAGFLIGSAPAFQVGRAAGNESLKKLSSVNGRTPAGRWLAGVQAGLAIPLAVAAGLLLASAHGILAGANFEPTHVALLRLRPRLIQYSPEKAQRYLKKVMQILEAAPGVESASLIGNGVALVGSTASVSLPGWANGLTADAGRILIGPRYFETLRTPILQGREFDLRDNVRSAPVAVVNEAAAGRFWNGGPVIGSMVLVNQRPHQVIGVVSNVELQMRDHPAEAFVYTPFWQDPAMVDARLCVRVKGDPSTRVGSLAREVNQVDPDVPVTDTIALQLQLAGTTRTLQITAAFVSYAAVVAILLSVIGLYGALSYSVSRRTKEIGIRLAIGARPSAVLRMVLREGMSVILVGVTIGLGLALAASQLIRHLLYGSNSGDAAIYLTVTIVVFAASVVACWIPARRAASVEPIAALRED